MQNVSNIPLDKDNLSQTEIINISNLSLLSKSSSLEFINNFGCSKHNFSGVDWPIFWDLAITHKISGVAELRDDGSRHRNILKLEVVN